MQAGRSSERSGARTVMVVWRVSLMVRRGWRRARSVAPEPAGASTMTLVVLSELDPSKEALDAVGNGGGCDAGDVGRSRRAARQAARRSVGLGGFVPGRRPLR